jgi:uncharacterized protein (TIGR02598 family)
MIRSHLRSASPQTHLAAFSLVEVTLSVAIIATGLLGIIGILPVGLDASKRAVDSTIVANILDSVQHRLQGQPIEDTAGHTIFTDPLFFDAQGTAVSLESGLETRPSIVYRADLTIRDFAKRPAHTGSLRAVSVALTWPVDRVTGAAPATLKPRTVVSFPVTTLTGTDWKDIARAYPSDDFVPKIGF